MQFSHKGEYVRDFLLFLPSSCLAECIGWKLIMRQADFCRAVEELEADPSHCQYDRS